MLPAQDPRRMKQGSQAGVESTRRVHQEFVKTSPIYCWSVNRTYLQVVLLEAAIIVALVVLGRFFS
jgi:hypothetical protein